MIVSPQRSIADTMLSTIEEFNESSSPKNKMRKLITANETEYRRRIIMFLKFLNIGLSCISKEAYK
jgi:hypothetical protein